VKQSKKERKWNGLNNNNNNYRSSNNNGNSKIAEVGTGERRKVGDVESRVGHLEETSLRDTERLALVSDDYSSMTRH
jgi:hypothetical protein